MLKKHSSLLVVFMCLLLTSCGFHLQGQMQLAPPLHRMYIQAPDPYGSLVRSLQQSLKMSNVKIVASPQEADTILVILRDENSQELLSVSGTQQTRQYNLIVTVTFEITKTQGETIVPPQTLSETRTITIQSNQILGSSNEASLFYQQMRRTLAYAMMNRLASQDISLMINEAFMPPAPKAKKKS